MYLKYPRDGVNANAGVGLRPPIRPTATGRPLLPLIAPNQGTRMAKAQDTALDMSGRRAAAQGLAAVNPSPFSRAVRSTRVRKLSTKSAKPKNNASCEQS